MIHGKVPERRIGLQNDVAVRSEYLIQQKAWGIYGTNPLWI